MKKVLITGAGSYIGTRFDAFMQQFPEDYRIDTVDMTTPSWRDTDFSQYDVVFHVAGLAHANPKPEMREQYYHVNTKLAVETAEHAKASGVKQFIFMSSMIVFGSKYRYITAKTIPTPENFYGDSKLQADLQLHKLQSDTFHVVSLRPPMIYGKGSKGNYPKLAALARKTFLFPSYQNQRSMLHIDNLCMFIKLIIEHEESGYFYPQNREYVSTIDLVKNIASIHGKKIWGFSFLNPLIRFLSTRVVVFNKLFGDMVYEKTMSDYADFSYCINDFETTVRKTEE